VEGNLLLSQSASSLSLAQFDAISEMPAAAEWFANLTNQKTRRAYKADVQDLSAFLGITEMSAFSSVVRGHILAWRNDLERRGLSRSSIRRKLSAASSLFDHLCERNAINGNPVDGVKRPRADKWEGKTPALGDDQARRLLDCPSLDSLKGLRDRAMLAVLLYHGLRREELCRLQIQDVHDRRGVRHLKVHGKGDKVRYIPLHPVSAERIYAYLDLAGRLDAKGDEPLFLPLRGRPKGQGFSVEGVYKIVCTYTQMAGIVIPGLGVHGLRATAATNALENNADIAKVQQWLGHENVSTTQLYDRRQMRAEDSPTYKVRY
jgi:site-specific recombinase XerD